MLKGLLACTLLCGAPLSALAGERDRPLVPDGRALLAHDARTSTAPGRRAPVPKPLAYVRLAFTGVAAAGPVRDYVPLPRDASPQASRFAAADPGTLTAWRIVTKLPEVTSTRGAPWAVRDILSDYRKPRHRTSALGTMFVLRIDGKDESPAFSVGGGGVAAALWRVVPRN